MRWMRSTPSSIRWNSSWVRSSERMLNFVAGWLPWMADAFALLFGVLALVWTALVAIAPKHFDVPLTALGNLVPAR